jgi:hypothetical protein
LVCNSEQLPLQLHNVHPTILQLDCVSNYSIAKQRKALKNEQSGSDRSKLTDGQVGASKHEEDFAQTAQELLYYKSDHATSLLSRPQQEENQRGWEQEVPRWLIMQPNMKKKVCIFHLP